jgi:hypothetical protein
MQYGKHVILQLFSLSLTIAMLMLFSDDQDLRT